MRELYLQWVWKVSERMSTDLITQGFFVTYSFL